MMPETIAILVASGFGMLGGIVRLLVVSLKAFQFRRISWNGFWIYAVIVIAVGVFSGVVLNFGSVLSFLAGYAGLDLIEGYYKTFMKTKVKVGK